jgi:ABC-type transport system involved in multi-copper enzyme maturation permease subunit
VSETRALSGVAATTAIAGLTWRRALRTRTTLGAIVAACLPIGFAAILHSIHREDRGAVWGVATLAAIVIASLVVAGPIGEEFEERTMTYLWSRPLPRWSVVTGKLVALVPLAALLFAGGMATAFALLPGDARSSVGDAFAAGALGALAMSMVAAAFATLVPRHALALTIAYLFFVDLPLGAIPAKLQVVSIAYHQSELSRLDTEQGVAASVIGLVAIAAVFLGVALWRVRRIE